MFSIQNKLTLQKEFQILVLFFLWKKVKNPTTTQKSNIKTLAGARE